jgi:hypothetical protein
LPEEARAEIRNERVQMLGMVVDEHLDIASEPHTAERLRGVFVAG